MRTIVTLLLAGVTCVSGLAQTNSDAAGQEQPPVNIFRRPSADIYGLIPMNPWGGGFGMNIMSSPISFTKQHFDRELQLRLGGEFYWGIVGAKHFNNVPLAAPQTGNASLNLTNNVLGFNFVARFSHPLSRPVIPYLDLFAGYRGYFSDMTIRPNLTQPGYESSTSQQLASYDQFNYGGTIGLMYSVSKMVKINTGLMLTYSTYAGKMLNMNATTMDGNSLSPEYFNAPSRYWMLKVGITVLLPKGTSKKCNCDCDNNNGTIRTAPVMHSSSRGGASNHVNINVRPKT